MAISQAQEHIDAIDTALNEGQAGTVQVMVDGTSVRYDREQALKERDYWRRQAARESGRMPVAGQINLGGAW